MRSTGNARFVALLLILAAPAAVAELYNAEAMVPPQCYTKHEGRYNPCYVCHQTHREGTRLNAMNDERLQSEYDFPEVALTNHWTNVFVDRRPLMAEIGDGEMAAYVDGDNYSGLAARLEADEWPGYIPNLADLERGAAAFDARGLARDGSGWVAFNYKPLPSTFWPTNGATDDVMIRLPPAFREGRDGPDPDLYLLNLSILEAAIKDRASIGIPPTDEMALGVDVNGDGRLTRNVTELRRPERYLGSASSVPVERFLYPQGTEFLHTVRYLGVSADGTIYAPPRFKELRYMRKQRFLTPEQVRAVYASYEQESEEDGAEDELPFAPVPGYGFDNGFGWEVLGFIEDARGELRPQTEEEGLFCMGCHAGIGATIDHTFAFPRKVTGAPGWRYVGFEGMPDAPVKGGAEPEILQYFQRVGGGDEFRENKELLDRFFRDGTVDAARVRGATVDALIVPSPERAMDLNKAYLTIVRAQSFTRGRDANMAPMENLYREVDPESAPTLPPDRQFKSDIRLDWSP